MWPEKEDHDTLNRLRGRTSDGRTRKVNLQHTIILHLHIICWTFSLMLKYSSDSLTLIFPSDMEFFSTVSKLCLPCTYMYLNTGVYDCILVHVCMTTMRFPKEKLHQLNYES